MFDAKTHLSALLERVAQGEEITITKHGTPVAIVVPAANRRKTDPRALQSGFALCAKERNSKGLTVRQLIEEGRRH